MKLQTVVDIPPPQRHLSHESSLLFIGSCFAENIGNLLFDYKFATVINPCGIAYNPASVANCIAFITGKRQLKDKDLLFHNGLWHSLHHHGRFSHQTQAVLKENSRQELALAQKQLRTASHIFLTLGTAWVFKDKATKQIVNNCHKLPAKDFDRFRLGVQDSVNCLQTAIENIRACNASAEIIFTVSPVRHLKDGLHENQLSKASLLLTIAQLEETNQSVSYFPAYEIAMDELRDYRFYGEDLSHLNKLGIQYIWERFANSYIAEQSQKLFPALQKLQKALNHKARSTDSTEHQNFLTKTMFQIEELEKLLPFVDFSIEKKQLQGNG